jgi:hypothetical protein
VQEEGQTRLDCKKEIEDSEVPDSMGIRRAKPETSKGQKEVNYTPGLTEWLVQHSPFG